MFKKNILNVILCGCASASVTLQDDVGGGAEKVSTLDRLKFLFGNVHNEVKDIENEVSAAGSDFGSNGSRKLLRAQRTRGVAHVELDVEDENEGYDGFEPSVFDERTFPPPIIDYNDLGFSLDDVAIDVISIGSLTRADYLKAQATTWASHVSIRHFWGITEIDDFDNECASMTPEELSTHVQTCKSMHTSDPRVDDFVAKFYGMSEGGRSRIDDQGWICAQRRIGRALGWIQSQYRDSVDAPDFLIVVDDDTLLDISKLQTYLQREQERIESRPMGRAGCIFKENDSSIPWSFPYGGFGTYLNREAILQLMQPVSCDSGNKKTNERVCDNIEQSRLGESGVYEDGMSVLEMFSEFSKLEEYCMHSDWLIGYMIKFYLDDEFDPFENKNYELLGMKNYPFCGNYTVPTGSVRRCNDKSTACHNQKPKDMESIVISSFVKSPSSYKALPVLATTSEEESLKMIKEKKEQDKAAYEKIALPNVLLIGAQKSGTTAISDWLFSNGVCKAEVFDNEPIHYSKEVHFFDQIDRYEQGVEFYTKRFQHCIEDEGAEFIMDATPETILEPKRVYSIYSEVPGDLSTSLKLIAILREPISRELSLYNHKVYKYAANQDTNMWYSDVADANGTIMSFEEYAEYVLKNQLEHNDWKSQGKYSDHLKSWMTLFNRKQLLILHYDEVKMNPEKVQWRIQEFLGVTFSGNLPLANEQDMSKKKPVPQRAYEVLEPVFRQKNEELYNLIESNTGPWMEQHPFPHFENAYKKFAYVSVLGRNPDESQNQVYVDAVRVLIRSLRNSDTKADIVILMLYEDETVEALLRQENALVKHINPIQRSWTVEQFEPWFVDIALAKLRALQLSQYERVQFIDADIAIEKNLDELFEYNPNTKLVSEGLGMDSPLRAGWFMVKPSDSDFQVIERIVKRGNFDENLGWDHLNLPCEYPGWQPSNDAKSWEFYGSQLEQGLLFHYFYALPKSVTPSENDFDLLTLFDDDELSAHGIIHFYGNRKPWGPPSDNMSPDVKAARSSWLQVYDNIRSTPEDFSSEVLSPLTEAGTIQYSKIRVLYAYGNQTTSTVKTTGGISMSDDFCSRPKSEQLAVSNAVSATIQDTACSTPSCHAEITSVCGEKVGRRLLSTRRLQDQFWQIEYLVTETFICEDATCSSPKDVATVAAIAHSISTKVNESIGDGSFISSVESYISLQATTLDETFFACLVIWGTVRNPESEIDGSGADVGATIDGSFYPDWKYKTGTCLNDGNEPTYMKINKAWISESLEKCCSRFYSGWNYSKCMNLQGSGLWYVNHLKGKCVTDCEEGNGPTCGGLANPTSDTLYSNPKSCCESKMSYQLAEFCEATSLGSTCYAGTGLYYRGDTAGSEVCVRDCDPASGDSTCGGLVKESNVLLHETAKACCASQYNWIDVELCSARSTKTSLEKYWADKSDSKCRKDSEAPTTDLSVQIYDTAEECCTSGIFWLSKDACLAASDIVFDSGTEAAGSNKFYVDWIKGQCVKDCVGPAPCGGLAQLWDPLYDSDITCCARIPHVPDEECVFS